MARIAKYGKRKPREVLVSESGWEQSLAVAKKLGCGSISELLEELGNHPEWIADDKADPPQVENAIATVLPTVPIKDRAIVAKAFRKLVAHLEKTD